MRGMCAIPGRVACACAKNGRGRKRGCVSVAVVVLRASEIVVVFSNCSGETQVLRIVAVRKLRSHLQYAIHLASKTIANIFPVVTAEAVSVEANFNDPRCETDERVCPNDPLLFTCTVTGSDADLATVRLSSGEIVAILSSNRTSGGGDLPVGVTVHSYNAVGDGPRDYTLLLAIDRASILNGSNVVCADGATGPPIAEASCLVAGRYCIVHQ